MYKSPIEIVHTEMRVQMENGIMKAVQDVGINVDKDELLKALAYDREQYQKGYADGREAVHGWISVEDRLPEEPCAVLVVVYGNAVCVARYNYPGCFETGFGMRFSAGNGVTHWMPLPEPPKMDGGAEE